jgi:F-type H+-transporting ATPase subunit gamma
MDTLESLAKRIDTTNSLQAIVRTMKALSAASIAQYDRAVASMSQYMRTVEMGLTVVLASGEARPRELESSQGAVMAILFGSDHSLCGGFNEIVVHSASTEHGELSAQNPWHWLAVGARAAHSLEIAGHTIGHSISLPGTSSGLIETSHRILLTIDDWRARQGVTRVLLFHNRRREKAATPHRVQLLPLDRDWLSELERRPWSQRTVPMFTMEGAELFSALAREYLFANIFRSGAESLASEHATRLAAMQAALRNIEEHLEEMTADYRRKRQDAITSELLDIVAGYETLRGER